MTDELGKRRVERLWANGRDLLQREAYEDALVVARQLELERFSGAFDLAAQALAALGRLEEAIETLQRGVELAPAAWLNWQLLGNYLSDAERYDEAATSYVGALSCANVWSDSIRLNQAVLAERRGKPTDALQVLDHVGDPALALEKADVRARLLLAVGEFDPAIEQSMIARCPDDPTPAERGCLARLCCSHGKALLAKGEAPLVVRQMLRDAIVTYPESKELLSFLRDIHNQASEHARLFALTVSYGAAGTEAAADAAGFVRAGRVIADSPEEAFSLLREVEGEPPFALDGEPEVELLEETPGALKGVISLSARVYFAAGD